MAQQKGANTVEPIRDTEKIREIKEGLLHQSYRNYFLFVFGINSGLRISDILLLRVMDVASATHLKIKEQKTDKIRKVRMTAALSKVRSTNTAEARRLLIICFRPGKASNRSVAFRRGKF